MLVCMVYSCYFLLTYCKVYSLVAIGTSTGHAFKPRVIGLIFISDDCFVFFSYGTFELLLKCMLVDAQFVNDIKNVLVITKVTLMHPVSFVVQMARK